MTTPLLPLPDANATSGSRSRRTKWLILAVIVLVLLVSAAAWWQADLRGTASGQDTRTPPPASRQSTTTADDPDARAPAGVRIRVRVINTTRQRGLAKRATAFLRDRGFDVVDFDSDPKSPRTSTLVITHTGHDDWSQRVRRALGTGSVDVSSDTSRYIDVTVLLGDDWHPAPQTFRP